MASKINADTSGGLKLISDTSGVIEFQSAGTTKAGVNGTGLTGNGSQITALTSGNLTGALPAIDGSALTGIDTGAPSQVLVNKSVTGGSVTATRAVSMAADGSVGIYPTINTLGTKINQSVSTQTMVAFGKGRTKLRGVNTQVSGGTNSNLDTNRVSLYGSYLNGSGVWVENATPLVIDCLMIAGVSYSENAGVIRQAPAAPGTDGKYVLSQTGRLPVNQISAIQVNVSTGAPTLFGSQYRYDKSAAGASDGGNFRVGSSWFGFWANDSVQVWYPQYYFKEASGLVLTSADLSSTLRGLFNLSSTADGLTRREDVIEGGRVYWMENNNMNNMAISSDGLISGSRTQVTITDDFQGEHYFGFLNGTKLLTYYRDTSGVKKFRTYSFNSSSTTLISTFNAPSNFVNIPYWAYKDDKNLFVGNGTNNTNNFSSVGLDSSFNILGTNVKLDLFNTHGDPQPRWTGTGNNFMLHLKDSSTEFRQPFTINAYATSFFLYGGVATASASSGTTPIAVAGVAAGYSGLTTGTNYHLADSYDGQLSTATTLDLVGKAISPTQIALADL